MTTLVVLVEHAGGNVRRASLEALGAAHATGADCVAVLTGDDAAQAAQTLGKGGASKAVVLTGPSEHSADAVASAISMQPTSTPQLPEPGPAREGEVVLTGATGFIGRQVVQRLLQGGTPVTAITTVTVSQSEPAPGSC